MSHLFGRESSIHAKASFTVQIDSSSSPGYPSLYTVYSKVSIKIAEKLEIIRKMIKSVNENT
ncbi:unnamed protein product [Moneuplotes crassus]|uniref:Uncharacterized protein n=1 Tax=Euplotes crassus TaxID=5936 RepID=A0AAD1XYB3_EUPCR|nr:unnamed protein product [Moneuplotes crassus]